MRRQPSSGDIPHKGELVIASGSGAGGPILEYSSTGQHTLVGGVRKHQIGRR